MKKIGQIQLSFGMIFSIIIIVAIIGTAIYFIISFLNLSTCTNIGIFQNDLKKEVDKAWKSRIYSDVFEGYLASGATFICFGDLTLYAGGFDSQYEGLLQYRNQDKNFFVYPSIEKCDDSLSAFRVEHLLLNSFSCIPVIDNKVKIELRKTQSDNLVRIGI